MRKPIIAANWKMNLSLKEAENLADAIAQAAASFNDREVLIYPTFLQFTRVNDRVKNRIPLGVQNVWFENDGAFTGEISASQIQDAGAQYVLLGHSERRHVLKETDALIRQKVDRVLNQGLRAMVCVGELLAEREAGKAETVVLSQLDSALKGLSETQLNQITIAYEPVWAIGTGKTATGEDAEAMHKVIRQAIAKYSSPVAGTMRILYGGSVKPDNIRSLMAQPNIDGALVGGASLKAETFIPLIEGAV